MNWRSARMMGAWKGAIHHHLEGGFSRLEVLRPAGPAGGPTPARRGRRPDAAASAREDRSMRNGRRSVLRGRSAGRPWGDGGGDSVERTGRGREGAGSINGIEDFELIERVADWSGHGASVASQCSA